MMSEHLRTSSSAPQTASWRQLDPVTVYSFLWPHSLLSITFSSSFFIHNGSLPSSISSHIAPGSSRHNPRHIYQFPCMGIIVTICCIFLPFEWFLRLVCIITGSSSPTRLRLVCGRSACDPVAVQKRPIDWINLLYWSNERICIL